MRIKKPFAIALILTRATNIDFFFSNDILNAKRNVAVYEGHINFRRKVQNFKVFNIGIYKFQKSKLIITQRKSFLNTWLIPFLSHFLDALEIIAFIINTLCLFLFIWFVCLFAWKRYQNGTCVFVHKIPLIKQSRDWIGHDY